MCIRVSNSIFQPSSFCDNCHMVKNLGPGKVSAPLKFPKFERTPSSSFTDFSVPTKNQEIAYYLETTFSQLETQKTHFLNFFVDSLILQKKFSPRKTTFSQAQSDRYPSTKWKLRKDKQIRKTAEKWYFLKPLRKLISSTRWKGNKAPRLGERKKTNVPISFSSTVSHLVPKNKEWPAMQKAVVSAANWGREFEFEK